jgi:hypothetical protein
MEIDKRVKLEVREGRAKARDVPCSGLLVSANVQRGTQG